MVLPQHEPLIGLDSSGNFNTAAAAAYPPELCRKLAQLIISVVPTLEPLREGQAGSTAGPFQFPPLPPGMLPPVMPVIQEAASEVPEVPVPGEATSDEDEFGQPRKLLVGFPGGEALASKLKWGGGKIRGF